MGFVINKITYILERPCLIVFLLVVILGAQVANLTQEMQHLKNNISISEEVHISMPTNTRPLNLQPQE